MLNRIDKWQQGRFLWILMIIVTVGLTCVAHYFFQDYLYMDPCEQCVYIRFAMLTMAIGGIVAAVYPSEATRIIGYTLGIYGCIIGIEFCLTLNVIHEAVHNADPFAGIESGCREVPIYPFNLPLHEWSSAWFLPTGDCGMDEPHVPEDVYGSLSAFQQFFVGTQEGGFEDGIYSEGWYLIPSLKFMNMAIACLLCFGCCLIALIVMLVGYVARPESKDKKMGLIGLGIIIVCVAVLYFVGGSLKAAEIARQSQELSMLF